VETLESISIHERAETRVRGGISRVKNEHVPELRMSRAKYVGDDQTARHLVEDRGAADGGFDAHSRAVQKLLTDSGHVLRGTTRCDEI